jgi:hypothetical protein
LFLSADTKRAEDLCSMATSTVYSSPRDSVQYSRDCRNSVDSELQGLEFKKIGLIVLVIAALYLFYRWARKRDWGFVVG